MTLWDAYQLANRRRAAVEVWYTEAVDGTRRVMRVRSRRSKNGDIVVDGSEVSPERAKAIEVERA